MFYCFNLFFMKYFIYFTCFYYGEFDEEQKCNRPYDFNIADVYYITVKTPGTSQHDSYSGKTITHVAS